MIVGVLMDEPLKKRKKSWNMPEGEQKKNVCVFVQSLHWALDERKFWPEENFRDIWSIFQHREGIRRDGFGFLPASQPKEASLGREFSHCWAVSGGSWCFAPHAGLINTEVVSRVKGFLCSCAGRAWAAGVRLGQPNHRGEMRLQF